VSTVVLRSNAAGIRLLLRALPPLPEGQRCAECGKRRYATRQAAEGQLKTLLGVPWHGMTRANAYHEHGWWHLTSGDKRKDAAAEAAVHTDE
jgi:hypothetical protein